MLFLLCLLVTFVSAQTANCPPSTVVSNCILVKKSAGCGTKFQFAWDPATAAPTVWPVFCMDDPNSKQYCKASPVSPSTLTSGLCKPRCVTNIKTGFYAGAGCPALLPQAYCVTSVANCGTGQTQCDWCAYNPSTNTCYAPFTCNNGPF